MVQLRCCISHWCARVLRIVVIWLTTCSVLRLLLFLCYARTGAVAFSATSVVSDPAMIARATPLVPTFLRQPEDVEVVQGQALQLMVQGTSEVSQPPDPNPFRPFSPN